MEEKNKVAEHGNTQRTITSKLYLSTVLESKCTSLPSTTTANCRFRLIIKKNNEQKTSLLPAKKPHIYQPQHQSDKHINASVVLFDLKWTVLHDRYHLLMWQVTAPHTYIFLQILLQ